MTPIVFARGELSVAAPKGSPVAVDADLKGLKAALAAGKVKHVAIANPETAPYGRAAQETLTKAGLWEQVQPLLVIGENIGQTATFVSTGAAEVGFIAKSLAISKEIAPKIDSAVVPGAWHAADRSRHGGDQGRFARRQGVRRLRARPAGSRGARGERLLRADVLI